MGVSQSIERLWRTQLYNTFLIVDDRILDFTHLFIAETSVIISKGKTFGPKFLIEPASGFLKRFDCFFELQMLH